MGREIRRVPPNWEHPRQEGWSDGRLQPMFDRSYDVARKEWIDGFASHRPEECEGADFWEWEGPPPDRAYYRAYSDENATWFQVYETVSEGTPVTPPFATPEELAQYLATHGDFWDQRRGEGPWTIENARAFVTSGWAPSLLVCDGQVLTSKEVSAKLQKETK